MSRLIIRCERAISGMFRRRRAAVVVGDLVVGGEKVLLEQGGRPGFIFLNYGVEDFLVHDVEGLQELRVSL